MGSETVRDTERLQRLLAYLDRRMNRPVAGRHLALLWFRLTRELARRRQGPAPG